MRKEVEEKWIRDTALLFYQIFSVNYENDEFIKRLLMGGGGNSTLCSTWTHLSDCFIKYRISVKAYNLLITKVDDIDKSSIIKKGNCVEIPRKLIEKKYHALFFNNAKKAEKRKQKGKYFHFDHNPSNKKVLINLENEIKNNNYSEKYLKKLANYIKQIQTVDLITVEEDEIRTTEDRKLKVKLDSVKRDDLISSEFYDLYII